MEPLPSTSQNLQVSNPDSLTSSDPFQGSWTLFLISLRRNNFLLLKFPQPSLSIQTWTSTGQLSRWRVPPTCPIPWLLQLSWSWPPQPKLLAMLPFPASSRVPLVCQFLWRKTSICHSTTALTLLRQCTTAKALSHQGFPIGTFLHPSFTSIISLPHLTWTARPSAC